MSKCKEAYHGRVRGISLIIAKIGTIFGGGGGQGDLSEEKGKSFKAADFVGEEENRKKESRGSKGKQI